MSTPESEKPKETPEYVVVPQECSVCGLDLRPVLQRVPEVLLTFCCPLGCDRTKPRD